MSADKKKSQDQAAAPAPAPAAPVPPQQQPQQQQPQPGMYPAMGYAAPPPGGMYPSMPMQQPGKPMQPGMPMYAAPGMPPTGAGFAPVGMQPQLVPMSSLPQAPFNVGADCEKLYKAMRGAGTDETALIEVLAYRTKPQLLEIAATYQRAHSKALAAAIHSDTSGHFRQLLLELLKPTDELLADIVHEAVHGPGTKDLLLIDVITQTTAQDMVALKAAYQRKYKETLQQAVHGDTSGDYRTLLLACVEATRPPPGAVGDAVKVEADAELLYRAGEHRLGTDEASFIRLCTHNSAEHLQLVSQAYQRLHGKTLEDAIRAETSGHFQDALIALTCTRAMHFARRIKYATRGAGTLDNLLCHIFSINDKMQLKAIGYSFQQQFKESMPTIVSGDTSGDYRRLLMALVD